MNKTVIIKDKVMINKRPEVVDQKIRMGDFEADLILSGQGNGKASLLTFCDRTSKKVIIVKLNDKSSLSASEGFSYIKKVNKIKIHTLTLDNGTEFAKFKSIKQDLGTKIYFARPYCSWERGGNENINRIVRKHYKKGTNFDLVTQEEVLEVQERINNTPRKSLGWRTPNQMEAAYLKRVQARKKSSINS